MNSHKPSASRQYGSSSARNNSTRIEHLETAVSNVAISLEGFIRETRDHRDRLDKDQASIWSAIRDQGESLSRAVDKLSSRGQISWGMIATGITTILAVGASVAAVGHMLMESRIKQLEITDEYQQKLVESNMLIHEAGDKFTGEMLKEHYDEFKAWREAIKK